MQRLILGCGKHYVKQPGDVCVDIRQFPAVDHVWDLNVRPWKFATDGQFMHASALHLVEHLRDLVGFMNEAWRVLARGGSLYLETPRAGADTDLEWSDPTHIRCYTEHSFINYFTPEGIETFGYTDRAWCIYAVRRHPQDHRVLVFHGSPIKP